MRFVPGKLYRTRELLYFAAQKPNTDRYGSEAVYPAGIIVMFLEAKSLNERTANKVTDGRLGRFCKRHRWWFLMPSGEKRCIFEAKEYLENYFEELEVPS